MSSACPPPFTLTSGAPPPMYSEHTPSAEALDAFFTDSYTHVDPLSGLDPSFVFDFQAYDDLDDGQRWSTWLSVEPLSRGTEADVVLLERADPLEPGQGVVMAAKRYRAPEHRSFHRSASYTEGRSMKRSRDERALKRKSTFGREVAAGEWAISEWGALVRLWNLGLPVPYPVQIDGTEILMEWITYDGETAPRLAQTRPEPEVLQSYFDQLRDALATMVQAGIVHGDLSAYNILAAGPRLVIIDLPQIVDLVGNQNGMDFLLRDCANICGWFRGKGLAVDEHDCSVS